MALHPIVTSFAVMLLIACHNDKKSVGQNIIADSIPVAGSYGYDAAFLKKHNRVVTELQSPDGRSKILLSADYQGRVMTSTANGDSGTSYGWLNYDLLSAREKKKQFNPVGGEERFWLGPEGGQYSLYFKGNDSFNFANWQVPPIIDTISYNIIQSSKQSVTFTKQAVITNYSGTKFYLEIQRNVNMLSPAAIGGQ